MSNNKRKRGVRFAPSKLDQAISSKFPNVPRQSLLQRLDGISERWLYRALSGESVDIRLAQRLASQLGKELKDLLASSANDHHSFTDAVNEEDLSSGKANPYRGGRPYEKADHYCFYGRESLVARVLAAAGQAIAGTGPRFLCLYGDPGVGKTSLLQAGVAASACNRSYKFESLVVRECDQRSQDLTTLCKSLAEKLRSETSLQNLDVSVIDAIPEQALQEWISRSFAQRVDSRTGLLLCIDDFHLMLEELEYWEQFIIIVCEIMKQTPKVCLAVTLTEPSARGVDAALARLPSYISETLLGTGTAKFCVESNDSGFLTTLIESPFSNAGIPLNLDEVELLLDQTKDLSRQRTPLRKPNSPTAQPLGANTALLPSPLALLSFTLTRLFDKRISENRLLTSFEAQTGASGSRIVRGNSESKFDQSLLCIEQAVNNAAQDAWDEANADGTVRESLLNEFLVSLISCDVDGNVVKLNSTRFGKHQTTLRRLADKLAEHQMMEVQHGRYRFSHQAVPYYWDKARQWRLTKGKEIAKCMQLLQTHETSTSEPGEEHVVSAITLLCAYMHEWVGGHSDTSLKNKCIEIFVKTNTSPYRIADPDTGSQCIHLAAAYGLQDKLGDYLEYEKDRKRRSDAVLNRQRDGYGVDASGNFIAPPPGKAYDNRTPLGSALWSNNPKVVSYLLAEGARVDLLEEPVSWQTGLKNSVLALAAYIGNYSSFQSVLKACDEVSVCKDLLFDPLAVYMAIQQGHSEIVKALLSNQPQLSSAPIDGIGLTPLRAASLFGKTEILSYLAEYHRESVTNEYQKGNNTNAFHLAAMKGHTQALELLVQLFPEKTRSQLVNQPSAEKYTPLMLAIMKRHLSAARILIPFSNVNMTSSRGNTALHFAIDCDVERRSSKEDGDHADGQSLLASLEVVRWLIREERCDLYAMNNATLHGGGQTPLSLAAKSPFVLSVLLDHLVGSDSASTNLECLTRRTDKIGNTLFHLIASTGLIGPQVESLIEKGKGEFKANDEGKFPLDVALQSQAFATAELLLNQLSDSVRQKQFVASLQRARDPSGRTALHVAHCKKSETAIDFILRHGKSEQKLHQIKDWFGRTPQVSDRGFGIRSTSRPSWMRALDFERINISVEQLPLPSSQHNGDAICDKEMLALRAELPFYTPDVQLIARTARTPTDRNRTVKYTDVEFFLQSPIGIHRLDGTSPPIHLCRNFLRIPSHSIAADFLRFFCFHVRGEHGPFLIIEHPDQYELAVCEPSAQERMRLKQFIQPVCKLQLSARKTDFSPKGFFLSATLWYSSGLFLADFCIDPTTNATVEMLSDVPIFENLSVRSGSQSIIERIELPEPPQIS